MSDRCKNARLRATTLHGPLATEKYKLDRLNYETAPTRWQRAGAVSIFAEPERRKKWGPALQSCVFDYIARDDMA